MPTFTGDFAPAACAGNAPPSATWASSADAASAETAVRIFKRRVMGERLPPEAGYYLARDIARRYAHPPWARRLDRGVRRALGRLRRPAVARAVHRAARGRAGLVGWGLRAGLRAAESSVGAR